MNSPIGVGLSEIISYLNETRPRIAIATHIRPDGDALGSAVGLAHVLADAGFRADIVGIDKPHDRFSFLDMPKTIPDKPEWCTDYDCLIVLDCGDWDRLEESARKAKGRLKVINIDHHASNGGFGDISWNNPHASSTGEMTAILADAAGWAISPSAANAFWAAISTDTGHFSYENTSPSTLRTAALCVQAGADPATIAESLYLTVSREERRLQRLILERMEFYYSGRLACIWLDDADLAAAGAAPPAIQELVNFTRNTEGVEVGVFFFSSRTGSAAEAVKVSVRAAKPHDALRLVRMFGGGGHIRAAGCTIRKPIADVKPEVIAQIGELYFAAAPDIPETL